MTVYEAEKTVRDYYRISCPDEEQDFLFTEALDFLIKEINSSDYMMTLGGWYYEKRDFELAKKYYEMAAEYKNIKAYACLGYIWYYGRTGEKDYEKAFKYYSLAADNGDMESAYKVADMYKNGYYVEKDYDRYKKIIFDLYENVKNKRNLGAPLPQIFIRLARIRVEEGNTEEAVNLYLYAKNFLSQRLRYNGFFGDLSNMKWLIDELYRLIEINKYDFDFYDLYFLLSTPNKISFRYNKKEYFVESSIEDGECVVSFNGKWFHSRDDFFAKAEVDNEKLTSVYDKLYSFEVR